jgi:hypothetical protein
LRREAACFLNIMSGLHLDALSGPEWLLSAPHG